MRKLSWAVIIFAALYAAWHMGRAYEGSQPVDFLFCREAADPEMFSCLKYTMPVRDARRFREMLRTGEVGEPAGKDEGGRLIAPRPLAGVRGS